MRNLVVKVKEALQRIEQEKGEFTVKCLVCKEPESLLWDLILSADWFEDDLIKRIEYLSAVIFRDFDSDCIRHFSGIITYKSNITTPLLDILRNVQENHRKGKYCDVGNDYVIVDSHDTIAPLIIPLNESAVLLPA